MTREASRNDFSEQHCLRIISKKYYSMLKFDAVALQNQLKNWKIEKYNYFCKNACYEQSTNELEIITVIPFSLMINSNQ